MTCEICRLNFRTNNIHLTPHGWATDGFVRIFGGKLPYYSGVLLCIFVYIKSSVVPSHRIYISNATVTDVRRWIYNVIVYWVSTVQHIWPQVADDSYIRLRISYTDTVRCRYNAHNFLEKPHNWYVIAQPFVRGMGFLLWVQTQIYEMLNHCIASCV